MLIPSLIAVTGGIGSGKSVVCNVLRALGYPVYDCDSRAKTLMDASPEIKRRISLEVCPQAVTLDGEIDRKALASAVFGDSAKLAKLNSIVHGAVRADIRRWANCNEENPNGSQSASNDCQPGLMFVETAILYESGLDREVEAVWEVTAPIDLRIARVQRRSGLTPNEIRARIASQSCVPASPHPRTLRIINDGTVSLLQQIHSLLHP